MGAGVWTGGNIHCCNINSARLSCSTNKWTWKYSVIRPVNRGVNCTKSPGPLSEPRPQAECRSQVKTSDRRHTPQRVTSVFLNGTLLMIAVSFVNHCLIFATIDLLQPPKIIRVPERVVALSFRLIPLPGHHLRCGFLFTTPS